MSEEKKIISRTLMQPREWHNVSDGFYPPKGQEVVIRLLNPDENYGEDPEGNLYAAEDCKIGIWMGDKWIIAPPYPKFDYSPLSNGPFLSEGVEITHWAIPEPAENDDDIGEIEAWRDRFSVTGEYNKLAIEIDKKHEEVLYRACSWGASAIRQLMGESPESLPLISVLWDIQALMDQDAEIRDGNIIKICGDEKEATDHIEKAKEALKEDDSPKVRLRDLFLMGMFSNKPISVYQVMEESSDGPALEKLAEGKNLEEVLNNNKSLAEFLYISSTDSSTVSLIYVKEG